MSEDLKTKIVITAESGAAVSAIKDARQEIKNTDQSVQGLSSSLGNLTAVAGGALSIGALTSAMKDAKQAAAEFDKALVEIGTLSTDAKAHIGAYREEIVALSIQTGQPLERLTKGLYDSISAGVGAGDAIKFMTAASQLATAGVSNTAATVDLLTSVLNAYGLPATEADKISDQLFATVQQGKTKIDDLAHSLGRVAPIMKAAGATTAEMMAATADLTNKLPSTAEAVTGLTALTAGLARGNKELTAAFKNHGYESALAAIKAQGFGEALKILNEESGGTLDGMMKLIPEITGANAALALGINNAQGFSDRLKKVNDSAGLTATAAKEIGETADMMRQKLDAASVAAKKAFGDDIIAAFGKSNGALREFLTTIARDHETRQLAEKMVLISGGALAAAAGLQKVIYPLEAYIVAQRAAAIATAATESATLAATRSMGAYGAATASATTAVGASTVTILGLSAGIVTLVAEAGILAKIWIDSENAAKSSAIAQRAYAESLKDNGKKIHDYALSHVKTAGDVAHLTTLVKMGIITQNEATAAAERYAKANAVAAEEQKTKKKELTAEEKRELEDRLKALEQFNDRWLKATLEKSAYDLEVAQKQYAEDLKLAGKSAELKAKALETYAATAKKIDDDVADKLNKTREAETKKEADALQKALDMREGYAVETAKILLKQDEAELKVLEERIKKAAQTNTLSIGQFAEYQSALKALTAKRVAEGEAVEEKSLIKMLEAENYTDAEREGIIAQHVARVASIRGEETAKEIASLDAVTAAVGEHARKQDEFWNTFRLTSDAIAEINKTTWTSIRDQIAQSIKTMKFDIAGLGDFFIATLRNIAATAAANQVVLSVAGAAGLTNGGGGIANLLDTGGQVSNVASGVSGLFGSSGAAALSAEAMGYTSGAATAGAGSLFSGGLLGGSGMTSGAAAQGLIGSGGALGGGLIGAGALTGIGLAVGAGLIASGVFSGSNGPPAGYDKNTYGGIGAIRNHPHDALAADTGLLSQHLQGGNAEGVALVLKQINELNTATSLLDQEFFKNTTAGRAMAQNWGDLTAQGAALANTIDQTGLSSTASAEGMTKMGASASSFAISAILTGQAGNELTTAAVGIATAMNAAAMETDKNLKAMGALGDALYKAGENTWALSRASSAAQLAQQMMNLSADMTFEQYQKLSGGASELTKIEQRRADLMKELAAGVDPERFAAIQAELKGMNAASEGYINSISGVATATGDATANSQDMATATDSAGQAAQRNTPHTDAIGTSFKTAGDRADYAAGRVYALRDEINKLESKTITVSVDTSTGAPAGKAAATGEWFVPANDAKYNLHYGESVLPANDASTYRSLVTQGLWNPLSRGLMPSAPSVGQSTSNVSNTISIVVNAAPGMDVSALAAEVERRLRPVILEQSERGIPWMHPRGLFGAA